MLYTFSSRKSSSPSPSVSVYAVVQVAMSPEAVVPVCKTVSTPPESFSQSPVYMYREVPSFARSVLFERMVAPTYFLLLYIASSVFSTVLEAVVKSESDV